MDQRMTLDQFRQKAELPEPDFVAPIRQRRVPPNRIKGLRESRKLTQGELGKIVGLDNTTISRHENGDRSLSPADIQAYMAVFKIEAWELFIDPIEVPDRLLAQDRELVGTAAE